jgi:uncharacterized damage-inducible protein DinB
MSLSQALLPEFDQEIKTTRRVLERVPEDRLDWQPHAKSMTLGRLAGHLGQLLHWGQVTVEQDSFDVAPPDGPAYRPDPPKTKEAILDLFDKNAALARQSIESASDEAWRQPWSLLQGGNAIFTQPKIGVLRGMVLNHLIHHRGQLTVYLRLNDVPVPAVYGPSADEGI